MGKARWTIISAVLIGGLCASASSADTTTPGELKASNTFHAEKSASIDVELEKDALWKWDVFEESTLRVKGDGRVAGFLLKRTDSKKPQGIYAIAFRVCAKAGCSRGWSGWVTRLVIPIGLEWPKKGMTFTIPKGSYRAYVITDGAPVDVQLNFSDIEGSASFSPRSPVRASVGMQSAADPVKNVFTAGSTHELKGRGGAVTGFVERHTSGAVDAYTSCLYKGAPSLPAEIAYTPACEAAGASAGGGAGASSPPFVTSGSSGAYSIRPMMRPGEYSYGGTYVGVQDVKDAAFVSLWITY